MAVAAVTVAVTVQLPLAAMVPPLKVRDFRSPATVTVAPHCSEAGVPVTVIPAGRASVKETPLMAEPLALESVMVMVDVSPEAMAEGEKTFVVPGGVRLDTLRVATGTRAPLPALPVEMGSAASLKLPAAVLVTLTETVQLPPEAMEPPVMPMVVPPTTPPVRVPGVEPALQVTIGFGTELLTKVPRVAIGKRDAGHRRRGGAVAPFPTIMVSLETPLVEMERGTKLFEAVSGAYTSRLALLLAGPAVGVWTVVTPLVLLS